MSHPIRTWAVAIAVAAAFGLAGGSVQARVHHHRHAATPAKPAAEATQVCDKHHHHCHPAAAPAAEAKQVCDKHHRHCHAAAATADAPASAKPACR